MDITLKTVTAGSPEYQGIWALREEVLRKPLGMSLKNEDLSRDADDKIIIALHNGRVIGCVMLHPRELQVLKLRAMAVYEDYRGVGIGARLVKEAEQIAVADGFKKIDLHARMVALDFYAKLGYTVTSDVFTEVGIPHVVMEKDI
jgi:predicted GNAT family N-acyltransferase